MRTAEICPTCATYENALCIIYNGPYLSNIDADPLDDLPTILGKINTNLVTTVGLSAPITSAGYRGKTYLNTTTNLFYIAKSSGSGASDWLMLPTIPSTGVPEYANNGAAILAGLQVGQFYRTGDVLKVVH